MLPRLLLLSTCLLLWHAAGGQAADPPVSLELAVEPGFEVDGQQRWMTFLGGLGFSSLRMRGARESDEPVIENRGSDDAPRYVVTGVLTADNRLALPGVTIRHGQRKELTEWLEKLRRGGGEAVTTATGVFGLTTKQLVTLHDALKKPVPGTTKGKTLPDIVEQLQRSIAVAVEIDSNARPALSSENVVLDELQGLSCGTALAAAGRPYGLTVTPIGQGTRTVGVQLTRAGKPEESWPIGTSPKQSPAELAPNLFKFVNVEINDEPLNKALEAIRERVQLPVLFDHNALARHEVDLSTLVNLPGKRTFYKKIIDQLLFQVQLRSELRVDEAGKPFLWITSTKK